MGQAMGPVALVTSPHAGSARGRDPEKALRDAGVAVGERIEVSALDARQPLGGRWQAAGLSGAVAAGGDGTVGAVASHLQGSDLALGILPLGTANDVARALALPLDLDCAAAVVAAGATRTMDLGCVRPATTEPGALDDPQAARSASASSASFVHSLTLGINVEFARLATNATRRQRLGSLTYLASALQCVTTFRPVPVRARLEGVVPGAYGPGPLPEGTTTGQALSIERQSGARTIEGRVVQIAAVVTPVFGGARNFRLPGVGLSDQLLDFVVVEALEARHLYQMIERLRELFELISRTPDDLQAARDLLSKQIPGLWRFKARAAHIVTPAEVDVTLDGEIRARTPLDVWNQPDALRVFVPAEQAATPSEMR